MNQRAASQAPHGTQAIQRAVSVLKHFADQEGEVTTARLAEVLGLSQGTVSRIVKALLAEGLLARNPITEAYYLGSTAVLLGQAAQRAFGLDRALPVLEDVNARTKESVNLAVRDDDESVVMLRVQSTLPLRFEQRTGARFPLYTTASGKAILAYSDDAARYLKSLPVTLEKLTPHTLGSPDKVSQQLSSTFRRGYSIDAEENVEGVRCVGAPILDADRLAQAAVVIQVPTVRMSRERERELGAIAVQAAREISRLIPVNRAMSL
ncbi:IclR family transcriptional regulator [Aeromicrobium sp. CF4.19]|uniref:IclR family transcriptional regulator n=1 Tax=Aeromicrobium sp. CF4.19 TaxID=3373082 RepID=UPI003EE6849C